MWVDFFEVVYFYYDLLNEVKVLECWEPFGVTCRSRKPEEKRFVAEGIVYLV